MDVLRFITAGSVDDGKSTLIGRLLYETGNIKSDILDSISATGSNANEVNLAHLTDGLRAERQQGITIDIAYKYFTTAKRKYIITDAPGHFQYTRNLVTGASAADVMVMLIDATNGITAQTRRHLLVASFLKMTHVAVAINKMDLAGYDEHVYNRIRINFLYLANKLGVTDVTFIPMNALAGDNVTDHGRSMDWYRGPTLLQYLEACGHGKEDAGVARLSIQHAGNDGYYGKLLCGTIKKGDTVVVNPAGTEAVVEMVMHGYETVEEAVAGQNVYLRLDNDVKVNRGDVLSHIHGVPDNDTELEADVCWLADEAMQPGKEYLLRINAGTTRCKIVEVVHKTDNDSFEQYLDDQPVVVNEFARVKITTAHQVAHDKYKVVRETGRGILTDRDTNTTLAAFVIP